MTDDRLFPLDDIPEVPFLRVPRGSRGAAISDERLGHDYPPEWHECQTCHGDGFGAAVDDLLVERGHASISRSPGQGGNWAQVTHKPTGRTGFSDGSESALRNVEAAYATVRQQLRADGIVCPDCLGMGSRKARVRLEAGHRCVRCGHPYMPKGDAKMLGVEPSGSGGEHMGGRWSACDDCCTHAGPIRVWLPEVDAWASPDLQVGPETYRNHDRVEAEWRILTVHHLDGDKANLSWWNLTALCQRCHLEIQGRVVMERIYPHEHSAWFRPFVAGYYAKVYLGEDLTREETIARLEELLDLERVAA